MKSLHCPKCGLRAKDVAENHDPFWASSTLPISSQIIGMTCANGHEWAERHDYKTHRRGYAMKGEGLSPGPEEWT